MLDLSEVEPLDAYGRGDEVQVAGRGCGQFRPRPFLGEGLDRDHTGGNYNDGGYTIIVPC
jgi:hypothetical protein